MADTFIKEFRTEDIPHPSEATVAIIEACSRRDVEVEQLATAIAKSPSITTEILRLANSPLYRLAQEVTSVQHATVLLGISTVQNMALSLAIKDAFQKIDIEPVDINQFWQESFVRAVAAQYWFTQLFPEQKDSELVSRVFTVGLLADIGLLVLFLIEEHKRDRWDLLCAASPDERLKMEQKLFGCDHLVVGSELIRHWQLPDSFSNDILTHHDQVPDSDLACCLKLADWSCALYFSAEKQVCYRELTQLIQTKGEHQTDQIHHWFSEMINRANEVLQQLAVSPLKDFEMADILYQANVKLADDNVSIQQLNWRLQDTLRERDQVSAKLNEELQIAREIQQSFQFDTSRRDNVAAINIPAKVLSGDFFDFYEHEDGKITFCLGDVSGKGTHAALVMAKTISLFRCLSKVENDLQRVVNLINDEMCETTTRGMFVTFAAGRLDVEKCGLQIVNAGHVPPFIIGEQKAQKIAAHGPPLGVIPNVEYQPELVNFNNSRLYLFTDGITEAKTEDGEELGTKNFLNWIVQSKNLALDDQLEWLSKRFQEDISNWQDDLTLMIVDSTC